MVATTWPPGLAAFSMRVMGQNRTGPVPPASPVLALALDEGGTTAELYAHGELLARKHLRQAGYARLLALVERHRVGFAADTPARPLDLWETATERHLAAVHELVSEPLVEWCRLFERLVLRLDHPLLGALPLETAHVDREPALLEHARLARFAPGRRVDRHHIDPAPTTGYRRFDLEISPGDEIELGAVALERELVEAAHGASDLAAARRFRSGESTSSTRERLVHLAGHRPRIDRCSFDPAGAAHVVLSGCDSLPPTLPRGVGSVTGSLWPVDDQANVTLMAALHARLACGLDPVEALRQAQIFHRSLPPSTWAAYVHLGSTN